MREGARRCPSMNGMTWVGAALVLTSHFIPFFDMLTQVYQPNSNKLVIAIGYAMWSDFFITTSFHILTYVAFNGLGCIPKA